MSLLWITYLVVVILNVIMHTNCPKCHATTLYVKRLIVILPNVAAPWSRSTNLFRKRRVWQFVVLLGVDEDGLERPPQVILVEVVRRADEGTEGRRDLHLDTGKVLEEEGCFFIVAAGYEPLNLGSWVDCSTTALPTLAKRDLVSGKRNI